MRYYWKKKIPRDGPPINFKLSNYIQVMSNNLKSSLRQTTLTIQTHSFPINYQDAQTKIPKLKGKRLGN